MVAWHFNSHFEFWTSPLTRHRSAAQTGTHPAVTTAANIDRFRGQLKALGFSYDWQREISTATANVAVGAAGAFFQWSMWQDPQWIAASPCVGISRGATLSAALLYLMRVHKLTRAQQAGGSLQQLKDVDHCFKKLRDAVTIDAKTH